MPSSENAKTTIKPKDAPNMDFIVDAHLNVDGERGNGKKGGSLSV